MIEVKNLCKDYGARRAVSDLNFTIESGHVYGFLGPNGAGKSTTMNILTGCLAATSGQVSIDGFDIFEDAKEAKSRIGYLPEQPPLYQDMTVMEYLKFVAAAKGVAKEKRYEHLAAIIALTQLEDVSDRLIKHLSKGYMQRVGVAQALVGDPEIIILDEPTVGLDPRQIIEIRQLIKELGKEHTVILSSHILSEVRSVCDRLLVIAKGKLVADDTPEALEEKYAPMSFEEIFLELTGEIASVDQVPLAEITQTEASSEEAPAEGSATETSAEVVQVAAPSAEASAEKAQAAVPNGKVTAEVDSEAVPEDKPSDSETESRSEVDSEPKVETANSDSTSESPEGSETQERREAAEDESNLSQGI